MKQKYIFLNICLGSDLSSLTCTNPFDSWLYGRKLNGIVYNLCTQQYTNLFFTVENYRRWSKRIKATPLSLYSTPYLLVPVSAFAPSTQLDPILPSFPCQNSNVACQMDTLSPAAVLNKVNLITIWWLKSSKLFCSYILSVFLATLKSHFDTNKEP